MPRKDRLLQTLGVKATRIRDRVFGPIGLDIGAEAPEEIALSIIAGILAAMNQRDGRQLNTKGKENARNNLSIMSPHPSPFNTAKGRTLPE